jgi:glycerol-3-phosphate acyltransferase PlsY
MGGFVQNIGLIFAAYVLGSLPFGLWVAKLWANINIREYGSGNIGVSNVLRTIGPVPAIIVLVLDAGKGLIPVLLAKQMLSNETMWFIVGIAAIIGHSLSLFANFKGGRGVATAGGVLLGLSWKIVLTLLIVWFVTLWISRFISLSSILAAVSLPISLVVFGFPPSYWVLGAGLALFVIWRHRPNIERLLAGTEYRIGEKAQKH